MHQNAQTSGAVPDLASLAETYSQLSESQKEFYTALGKAATQAHRYGKAAFPATQQAAAAATKKRAPLDAEDDIAPMRRILSG